MDRNRSIDPTRVILHIDLDCFYCQVEQRRLGIPPSQPLAVQQWSGLIAVNYASRAKGVTRHMRVQEAKRICPELQLVHVETIGGEDDGIHNDQESAGTNQQTFIRQTQKACLERYRRANAEIMEIIHKEVPDAVVEKASIDEVYIDCTKIVDEQVSSLISDDASVFAWGSLVVISNGSKLNSSALIDRRLAYGAKIASQIRGAILQHAGFTASAGIASNKLLAKVGSAKNKPNQQTLIHPSGVELLMAELPLRKLRNFGGKLGDTLQNSLCCKTVSDVARVPLDDLRRTVGEEKAAWIQEVIHGHDDDPVREKEKTKSMLAAKSFSVTGDIESIRRWIGILAAELAPRILDDYNKNHRRPKTLGVHFRKAPGNDKVYHPEKARRGPMPRMPAHRPSKDAIAQAAMDIFMSRCISEAMPCNRLAISASDWQDCPNETSSITRFFTGKKDETSRNGIDCDANTSVNRHDAGAMNVSEFIKKSSLPSYGTDDVPKVEQKYTNDGSLDPLLVDIDIAEQARLLKEATMLNRFHKHTSQQKYPSTTTEPMPRKKRDADGRTCSIQKFFKRGA